VRPNLDRGYLGGQRVSRVLWNLSGRNIDTIDSELRLVASIRSAAQEQGGPLPSTDVADALLDEPRQLIESVRH
jgi:hypothetical protein